MSIGQEIADLKENLADLRRQSLKIVALCAIATGYAWFIWGAWPGHNGLSSVSAWIGIGLLLSSGIASCTLRSHHLCIAAYLVIWGILGAVFCAALTFPSPVTACLFVLPVIFASVLLDRLAVFLIAIVASSVTLAVNFFHRIPLRSTDAVFPVAVILLVAVASWLSVRNLYIALAWVWNGYERARKNEEAIRDHQAQLKRALKALDEAMYRLERANYMLALARDQAEESRRLKQQFAQTISHELRTPLNLIVGFTEVMAHSPEYYGSQLPPAYLRDLGIVYRNACHLQDLVSDVLDLACIEAAQMSLVLEKTDPATLIQEAVNTVRSLVESRGLALHTEIEPGLPPLWIDATRIRQVLFNLINNAVRFTERGKVTVSVCQENGDVCFAVADTGIGIAPEDIQRIFEEFQQVDGSTRRCHEGAGLGLAISRRFVELHKGRIWVESKVGQGSTFYFRLPVDDVGSDIAPDGRWGRPFHRGAIKGSEEPILLAVTRSSSAAMLMTRYISGFRTIVVPDLEQAGQTAQQLMPQAVVIDESSEALDLAGLEGLAREWGIPRIPLIACPLSGEELFCKRLSSDGYLVKPVSRLSLWDMLRRFGEGVDKVLVIDDDQDFVLLMSRILEDSPVRRYQVMGASTGREGLALMRYQQPDLVLLDLVLPDMDGLQVLECIRANPEWQHIPVVVVSAKDEVDYQAPMSGMMVVAKKDGLTPREVVQWVQSVASSAITFPPAPVAPRAVPVL